jgi:hypothetical protein
MSWTNNDSIHRHACHAYEDFRALRKLREVDPIEAAKLWHSISHHLRHAVYRSSHEVSNKKNKRVDVVRRSHVSSQHK